MQKIVLQIKGMHCASCAKTIEKSLMRREGVILARVNFPLAKATIEYDPQKIKPSEIVKTIKKAGYDAQEFFKKEVEDEIKIGWQRFWLGLFLTLPVFIIATFFMTLV